MSVDWKELQLVWPADLFADEAHALLKAEQLDDDTMGWLFVEAFHDDRGLKWLQQQPIRWRGNPEDVEPWADLSARRVAVADLLHRLTEIPPYEPPRLWKQRRRDAAAARPPAAPPLPWGASAWHGWVAQLAAGFDEQGYLDDAFGSRCVDARRDVARDDVARSRLAQHVGNIVVEVGLWPLVDDGIPVNELRFLDDDDVLTLIEALDLYVRRPRHRSWHDYGQEWDYDDHARVPGQAVYRWRVNELLAYSRLPWRLACAGTDAGRLVEVAGDDRDDLVHRLIDSAPDSAPSPEVDRLAADDRAAVSHAVELFRARGAGRDAKRSAIVALAGVLEQRRGLLQAELLSRDEGALFQIANQFDLRHRDGRQHNNYAEDFLDWIFWWYLATIELTNRLLHAQTKAIDVRDRHPAPAKPTDAT